MPVKVGDEAPDFELLGDTAGLDAPTYRLSDALRRSGVVLQFFPLPFTTTCLAQMCAVRDHVDRYSDGGVTVWGVTGHYPQLIAAWEREEHFGVPILADYDHEVSRQYVGLYEDRLPQNLRLTTKRGVVGISRDRVIRFVWVTDVPREAPPDDVVEDAIRAAAV